MAHVSTFLVAGDTVYMTYYANTKEPSEDPKNQTARLVYAPVDDLENKTFLDLQTTGDRVGDKSIDMVYDTILMQKDADTLYIVDSPDNGRKLLPFLLSLHPFHQNLGKNRCQPLQGRRNNQRFFCQRHERGVGRQRYSL